jgi:methylated-DNA-protein-cysteine methyltransferase related protein
MAKSMFQAMLAQVRRIPRGKVATYGDVAYAAGFPGSARQVVWALHSSQGLPWHRVVGSGGKILLPGESGFEQRMRLQAEGVQFRGQRIAMDLHHHSFFGTSAANTSSKKKPSSQKKRSTAAKSTRRAAAKKLSATTSSANRRSTNKPGQKKRARPPGR